MAFKPLTEGERPCVLFRAEHRSNTSLRDGYILPRERKDFGGATVNDFHNHLVGVRTATPFVSFGSWSRAMHWRRILQTQNRADIVIIAIWVKDLPGLYSAEDVAQQLGYPKSGSEPNRRATISAHHGEYLVEGGIKPDEYRILAIFEGGGLDRTVVFESRFCQITTTIPDGFFPGRRLGNALQDIQDEIWSRLGVRNEKKRDELVKAISGPPRGPLVARSFISRQ
ncbi:uncharacterized protein BDW70DRAFT_168115 [Aspergillus foveolatus]|uniref:uncharacterized protein n=1 Tax=Aspergillus foveolatus TaxID=210207 RepID=UPI003CCD3CD5